MSTPWPRREVVEVHVPTRTRRSTDATTEDPGRGRGGAGTRPRNIHEYQRRGCGVGTRPHRISASRPRRRRDSSEKHPCRGHGAAAIHKRNVNVAAEAPPRPVRGISTSPPRRRRDPSAECPRGGVRLARALHRARGDVRGVARRARLVPKSGRACVRAGVVERSPGVGVATAAPRPASSKPRRRRDPPRLSRIGEPGAGLPVGAAAPPRPASSKPAAPPRPASSKPRRRHDPLRLSRIGTTPAPVSPSEPRRRRDPPRPSRGAAATRLGAPRRHLGDAGAGLRVGAAASPRPASSRLVQAAAPPRPASALRIGTPATPAPVSASKPRRRRDPLGYPRDQEPFLPFVTPRKM